MENFNLPEDQATLKAVERRRSAEAARKARIYDTRVRVMGLDVDALNKQVEEKQRRQTMEILRDKTHDEMRQYHDAVILQQVAREKSERAAVYAKLTQHWATHQRVEDSRDADLKCSLKGAVGISIPEGAPLGPASMQVFQGEGTEEEQRRKEQMKKTGRELQAQREENERRVMKEKHREKLLCKELVRQDTRGVQMCAEEERCRRAARIDLSHYNQALAAEQAEKAKEEQRREERQNLSEIWHTLASDLMTEEEAAAAPPAGPVGGAKPRLPVDRWKGMSDEQRSAIRREREKQCVEQRSRRQAERARDAACDLQLLKLSTLAEEEERRRAALERQKRLEVERCNRQLAREQQAAQDFLNKTLYTNRPSRDYFLQFNTGSR